jgi:hypothetical protein
MEGKKPVEKACGAEIAMSLYLHLFFPLSLLPLPSG